MSHYGFMRWGQKFEQFIPFSAGTKYDICSIKLCGRNVHQLCTIIHHDWTFTLKTLRILNSCTLLLPIRGLQWRIHTFRLGGRRAHPDPEIRVGAHNEQKFSAGLRMVPLHRSNHYEFVFNTTKCNQGE